MEIHSSLQPPPVPIYYSEPHPEGSLTLPSRLQPRPQGKKIPVQLSVPWWPTVLVCLGLNSFLEHRAFSIVLGKSVLYPTQTLAEAGAPLSASCLLLSVASFLGEEDWLEMEVEKTQDIFRSGHYLPRSDRCLYRLACTVHSQSIC